MATIAGQPQVAYFGFKTSPYNIRMTAAFLAGSILVAWLSDFFQLIESKTHLFLELIGDDQISELIWDWSREVI